MRAEDLDSIFVARAHHRPITVASTDAVAGSRIGGRAPDVLAGAPVRCRRCGGAMAYDLTLAAADLGAAEEVSHFHCQDFQCLLKSRALDTLRDPPSTFAVAHATSRRAPAATGHDSAVEPRALTVGPPRDAQLPSQDSKIGGHPGFVQGEGPEATLAAAGLGFLFQFSEADYPKGMAVPTYPFAFGILY
ncbi:MAG: hypothetical protein ABUS79_25530, partial [Pseudomonadota bacterium]